MITALSAQSALLLAADLRSTVQTEGTPSDQVSFSVQASGTLAQNRVEATLFTEAQRLEASDAADEVNNTMAKALKALEGVQGIDYSTPGYQTYPVYNEDKVSSWRVRQTLALKSEDKALMTSVLQELQQTLSVQNLVFSISDDAREEAIGQLTRDVLNRFRRRAKLVSSSLEAASWGIVSINIDDGYPQDRQMRSIPMMARDAGAESMAAPALEGGQSDVTVTASATIKLIFD